ncbi:MAG: DNA methyltransferase [Bryobacteraceae bacterium]
MTIDLASLKPNPRNPRTIDDAAFAKICESIRRDPEFMALRPIVIDPDNLILGGNQRYRACRHLGMTTVPDAWVVRADNLTSEQRKRFVIIDNAPEGASGEWDFDVLAGDWDIPDLEALGLDVPHGMDDGSHEPDSAIDEDKAEVLRKKWGTTPGQLWAIGQHRLLCGDSTNPAHWARLMNGERAVLCHTDPPYGVSYAGGDGKPWEQIAGDSKRDDDLLRSLLVPALKLAVQHTDPDAAFYIWHASSTRRDFDLALQMAGLQEKQYVTWIKDSLVLGHADYQWQTEPAFYAQKDGETCRWYGDRAQSTVWRVRPCAPATMSLSIASGVRLSNGEGDLVFLSARAPKARKTRLIRIAAGDEVVVQTAAGTAWEIGRTPAKERLHPTQKPTPLFRIPLLNHTKPGELVVEPFTGGGGQFLAAEELGRRCYGMDLEPKWIAATLERMANAGVTGKLEGTL